MKKLLLQKMTVRKANQLEDPLSLLETCRTFNCKNGTQVSIRHYTSKKLTPRLLKWILDIMRRNMREMYQQSKWGWKPSVKKAELTEESARFLIAFSNNKPIAFSHFRFDLDYNRMVIYCYEIQLESSVRSLGLGKNIMCILEKLSVLTGMDRVVLTVFKHNQEAIDFFKRLGYETDESCPSVSKSSDSDEKLLDYFILSKKNS